MRLLAITLVTTTALMAGCATTPTVPTYIDPVLYTTRDCKALAGEIERIEQLAKQSKKSNLSAAGVGVGIIGGRGGIYPTISFGVGKAITQDKEKLAELYGKYDAMVIAARQNGCAFAQNIKTHSERQ